MSRPCFLGVALSRLLGLPTASNSFTLAAKKLARNMLSQPTATCIFMMWLAVKPSRTLPRAWWATTPIHASSTTSLRSSLWSMTAMRPTRTAFSYSTWRAEKRPTSPKTGITVPTTSHGHPTASTSTSLLHTWAPSQCSASTLQHSKLTPLVLLTETTKTTNTTTSVLSFLWRTIKWLLCVITMLNPTKSTAWRWAKSQFS